MLERESPGPGEVQVGARVTRSRWSPGGDQSHQVQMRPRCGIEYPVPNDAWVRTRVTRAMQAQMGNRITRSW